MPRPGTTKSVARYWSPWAWRPMMIGSVQPGTKRGTQDQGPAQDQAQNQAMMMEAIGRIRRHVEENFDDVGDAFASEARAIHEGRSEDRGIYGQATSTEVRKLVEDGVPVLDFDYWPVRKNAPHALIEPGIFLGPPKIVHINEAAA